MRRASSRGGSPATSERRAPAREPPSAPRAARLHPLTGARSPWDAHAVGACTNGSSGRRCAAYLCAPRPPRHAPHQPRRAPAPVTPAAPHPAPLKTAPANSPPKTHPPTDTFNAVRVSYSHSQPREHLSCLCASPAAIFPMRAQPPPPSVERSSPPAAQHWPSAMARALLQGTTQRTKHYPHTAVGSLCTSWSRGQSERDGAQSGNRICACNGLTSSRCHCGLGQRLAGVS